MGRDKIAILRDICEVAGNRCNKTRIVYGANLNFKIVKGYLDALVSNGLVVEDRGEYLTTAKGFNYVKNVRDVERAVSKGVSL